MGTCTLEVILSRLQKTVAGLFAVVILLQATVTYNGAYTFSGVVTLANSSVLGTPASINLTNATAFPYATGGGGLLPLANGGTNCATPYAINAQTTTYQVLAADFTCFKTISVASGTFTITLVASGSQPVAGTWLKVVNYGSGVVTIARSGQNINGGTTSLTLQSASATVPSEAWVFSDGTNYFVSGSFLNPMTAAGDIIYASTTGLPTRLPAAGASVVLHGGTTPSWSAVAISTDVTGLGTGVATFLGTPSGVNFNSMIASGGIPLVPGSHSAAYTTVLADGGSGLLHPTADNNARTFTIDSNANVAYPVGTTITIYNQINTLTIAITSDTLVLGGTLTTGSRTLAAGGVATAWKITSTLWVISGPGLS